MLTTALRASRVVFRNQISCLFGWSNPQGDQALTPCLGQQLVLQRCWFWNRNGRDKQQVTGYTHPVYPQKPHSYRLGDANVTDGYWWLSDYTQARPYLVKEQQYYQQYSRLWSKQAQQLLQEMKQDIAAVKHADPPETVGQFEYWTEDNPHGHDSVKRRCLSTNQEQVLLSEAVLRDEAAQLSKMLRVPVAGDHVNSVKLSQDQGLLAYAVSLTQGAEQYCCVTRDLSTGALVAAGVVPHATSFEWSADSSCLYYCMSDDTGRPSKVYRRHLHTPATDDLLFSDTDPKHFVTLTRTKDWRYVLINSHSKLSSEVHLVDAHDSQSQPVCVQARSPGLEYFVEHVSNHLLLLTNKPRCTAYTTRGRTSPASCPESVVSSSPPALATSPSAAGLSVVCGSGSDYALMTIPAAALQRGESSADQWCLLIAERHDVAIVDMDVFSSCIVLHELAAGRPALTVLRLAAAQQQEDSQAPYVRVVQQQQVLLPEWVLSLRPGINQDYWATQMRVYASSPVVPEVAVNIKLDTGETSIQQEQQRQQQQQQQHYCCWRLWATAVDGVQVPVTLLHRRGLPYNGLQPLLVEVYGSYGQVLEADYKAYRMPLLQRGWSVALAHVRGGGELGRRWHAAGRQLQKPNSVADLLACLQLLVDMGVTAPGKIAAYAASAGGLTLAAAVNSSPQMFAAVALEAPFVDWAGAMGDAATDELLAEHETDEWGDPQRDPQVAQMIYSMCPYTNLTSSKVYPAMLLTAGLIDTRVPFSMPAKYVAKARQLAMQQGEHRLVLLQFDEAAGHFSRGQSGGSLEDIAWQYAFLMSNCR